MQDRMRRTLTNRRAHDKLGFWKERGRLILDFPVAGLYDESNYEPM
jgi:hypothetical protein